MKLMRQAVRFDFDHRVRAVQVFRSTDAGRTLAAANKRIGNILKKADIDVAGVQIDFSLMDDPAESSLWNALEAVSGAVAADFAEGAYEAGLSRLAPLKEPVDAFFDSVMVMAEDESRKRNRLAILRDLAGLFLGAADFSRLQG